VTTGIEVEMSITQPTLHHSIITRDDMMHTMRTTVTLDPDTRLLVERAMRERGLSFKDAVNEAIRAGLSPVDAGARHYTTPRNLGPPRVDIAKALGLAGQLEDEALARRLAEGR
jgi:hypothetical protein